MGISNFYTLNVQAAATGMPQTALGGNTLGGGLNFIDFILGQLAQKAGKESGETGALQSDNPLLSKNPKLDIAALIGETPQVTQDVNALPLAEQEKLFNTLALNQQAFDKILRPLMTQNGDGTITIGDLKTQIEGAANGKIRLLDSLMIGDEAAGETSIDSIKAILEKIQNLAAEGGAPVFIATNLTPEQITELQDIINGSSGKTLDDTAFAGVFIGLIQIVPPGQAKAPALSQAAAAESDTAMNTLAASLNEIVPGGEGEGYESNASLMKKPGSAAGTDGTAEQKTPAQTASADGSLLQNWPFAQIGSLFTTPDWAEGLAEKLGGHIQNALGLTGLSHAVNVSAHAGHASLPHPATQMVAATLQRNASDGEARNIVLQLDPPELGRVEIRMSIGKDKSMKAVVIAEKPETMMMLQRDAHILERSLEGSGLDADGGLSFELAQEGYDFNHNGGHDSYGGGAKGKQGGEDGEPAIIETTMTWHVDPATGHMRYNIMA